MGLSEPTCKCGHETRWHGDLGCGYLGWSYGKPKCGCRLTDSEVVRQIVAAALTEAADDVLTEFDPPIEACIWASEWLRDRAARMSSP